MTALYQQHGELFIDRGEFHVKCTLQGGSISDFFQILYICMLFTLGSIMEMPNFFKNKAFTWFLDQYIFIIFYFPILHLGELQPTCKCFTQNRPTLLYSTVYSVQCTQDTSKVVHTQPLKYLSMLLQELWCRFPYSFRLSRVYGAEINEDGRLLRILYGLYILWCITITMSSTPIYLTGS